MASRTSRTVLAALIGAAALAPGRPARAAEMTFGPNDVPTVFFIAKSDDRNRVDYGLRLDATCSPVNDDALVLYWREFEKSPPVRTHPLSLIDHIPYGVSEQRALSRSASGGAYTLKLKQLARPILITTRREADGKCSATAWSTIGGQKAQFLSVFAKLASAISVDYIDIFGKHPDTGAPLTERVKK
jgi:Domain of unknown function (DUF4833)